MFYGAGNAQWLILEHTCQPVSREACIRVREDAWCEAPPRRVRSLYPSWNRRSCGEQLVYQAVAFRQARTGVGESAFVVGQAAARAK